MAGAGRRGAGVGSWRRWGRASPLSSRGSPWRLGTPTAPEPGVEHASLALAGGFFTTSATWEAPIYFLSLAQGDFPGGSDGKDSAKGPAPPHPQL